ncbi:MAG TPA: YggT family protein [Candidatus Saccharimonadales bacterium]|nr:YggT family protein [Candidatus Saccharimonadales bacterium]
MWVTRVVAGLINFFLVLVEAFLGVRVLLRFFAANPDNGFVQWVYNSTNVLMEPFRGIFQPAVIAHNHVIDFSALFAMVVYGLVALAFAALANWLSPARYVVSEPVVKKR